jgi:hypothetical protein
MKRQGDSPMDDTTHLLRVTLQHVTPKVTRDLLVPSNLSLARLHQALQVAMGWEDAHLHEFIVGTLRDGQRYGPPASARESAFDGPGVQSENRATLQQIVPAKGGRLIYWYDFGDDWYHEIVVKEVAVAQGQVGIPRCVAGAGACPPEDCGGPPGYANLLEAISDPKHEDHEDMLDWVGDGFDPAAFDLEGVNEELAYLASRWNKAPRRRKADPSSASG